MNLDWVGPINCMRGVNVESRFDAIDSRNKYEGRGYLLIRPQCPQENSSL